MKPTRKAERHARAGRCVMEDGRCMVATKAGAAGRIRIEMPGWMCGRGGAPSGRKRPS